MDKILKGSIHKIEKTWTVEIQDLSYRYQHASLLNCLNELRNFISAKYGKKLIDCAVEFSDGGAIQVRVGQSESKS